MYKLLDPVNLFTFFHSKIYSCFSPKTYPHLAPYTLDLILETVSKSSTLIIFQAL